MDLPQKLVNRKAVLLSHGKFRLDFVLSVKQNKRSSTTISTVDGMVPQTWASHHRCGPKLYLIMVCLSGVGFGPIRSFCCQRADIIWYTVFSSTFFSATKRHGEMLFKHLFVIWSRWVFPAVLIANLKLIKPRVNHSFPKLMRSWHVKGSKPKTSRS